MARGPRAQRGPQPQATHTRFFTVSFKLHYLIVNISNNKTLKNYILITLSVAVSIPHTHIRDPLDFGACGANCAPPQPSTPSAANVSAHTSSVYLAHTFRAYIGALNFVDTYAALLRYL